MDPATFGTVGAWAGGGLAGSVMTFALARAYSAYTRPKVSAVLTTTTFRPPTSSPQMRLTMDGKEFDAITLVTFVVTNKCNDDLTDVNFVLKGADTALALDCSREPSHFSLLVENDPNVPTDVWVKIPTLKKGDMGKVVFAFGRKASVNAIWRGAPNVRVVDETAPVLATKSLELVVKLVVYSAGLMVAVGIATIIQFAKGDLILSTPSYRAKLDAQVAEARAKVFAEAEANDKETYETYDRFLDPKMRALLEAGMFKEWRLEQETCQPD